NRPGAGGGGTQWPGGGNRPGWANRPGAGGGGTQWPGGGNRPGWANRPGAGGNWAGNRPGWGNRPGFGNGNIGSGNIGSGNIGRVGDNLGVVNRPNYGGNTVINNSGGNYYGGNNFSGGGNSYGGGRGGWGYGGGGGWGYGGGFGGYGRGFGGYGLGYGGFGGYGLGYGGFGGGWATPYYGSWYQGWGGNLGSFWGGYGLGALTSFGLGSAFGGAGYYGLGSYGYGGYGYPIYGGYGFGTGYGVYDYFPTWGISSIGGWGLGSLASTWLSTNYVNPYYTTVVAAQPAVSTVVYDYAQPINVTAAPPDPTVADSTEQVFSAGRDAFKAGDYQRALDLADQVLKATPNAPVVHEFRALCLFALKRYEEAATVAYAVLSAGPCWNWSTLVGLYPDVDTYTNQLRGLEAAVRSQPNATPDRFLLAYHYLVQGNNDAAGAEFANVAKLEPKDQLAASFAKAFTKTKEVAATAVSGTAPAAAGSQAAQAAPAPAAAAASTAPAPGAASATEPAEAPPPPPAELTGTWKASPAPDTAITLSIAADGAFTWDIAGKGGQNESIAGKAVYTNDILSLTQENGPPLAGKIDSRDASKFVFHLMGGGANTPALTFTR
ncbi:MAG TPA: tetratricopeptide repeat protein, partial [Isosphaeraceae bacterium]|nr:tetratricopeptide repeat protein [Isosphaeraceae bacterium]